MSAVAATTTEILRQAAAQALSEGKVGVVIGYGRCPGTALATPVFARTPEDTEQFIFDESCVGNLAVYLSKPEVRKLGRTGLVVKGCDRRAVNVLLREHVIARDDVWLLGVRCAGVGDPPCAKCASCDVHEPQDCDAVVGELAQTPASDETKRYAAAEAVDAMSLEERWAFWSKQLEKCIRCYACRQVCPLCYCKRCIVEKSEPQWVETSPHLRGNLAWNVVRAFHLTGRCIGCAECERVCPVNIPLSAINQKMAQTMDQAYGFRSGDSPDEKAPFSTWSPDDPENNIL